MTSLLRLLDGFTFNLFGSSNNISKGIADGHALSTAESGFELGSGVSYLSYYVAWVPNNLNTICKIFSIHIPHITAFVGAQLEGVPLTSMLAYLGFATSGFKLCKETLSLIRQQRFLVIFDRHAWNGEKIRNTLTEVVESFEKPAQNNLPGEFLGRISRLTGEQDHLRTLLRTLYKGDQKAEKEALKKAALILNSWTGSEISDTLEKVKRLPTVAFELAIPATQYEYMNKSYLDFLKAKPKDAKLRLEEMKTHVNERLGKLDLEDPNAKKEALKEADLILKTWTGRDIRDALEEVKNLPSVALERALPDWLNEDIASKGGKDYLNTLLKKVYKGDKSATEEATKLLDNMKSYASKKRVLHLFGIAAAIVGGVSCIGFLISCPLALTIVFLIAISLLAVSVYMVRQGYVENRKGDFSLIACVPEGLHNIPAAVRGIPDAIKAIPQKIQDLFKSSQKEIPPQFRHLPPHLLPPSLRPAALQQAAVFSA